LSPVQAKPKILFIAGPGSHGYGAHEFRAGCLLLANELKASGLDLQVAVSEGGWPEDGRAFEDLATVVMMCTGEDEHLLNHNIKAFDELAAQGVGLVCLHTAVITIKGEAGDHFLKWMGGFHELDYSVVAHWKADFKKLPDHPVTRGIKPFAFNDEWYYFMRFVPDMKGVTPILSAHPNAAWLKKRKPGKLGGGDEVRAAIANHEIQHVAWAYEREGGDRGFGFTGAHDHWYFADPNYRRLVLNAICWSAKMKIPATGVPVRTLTINDLLANQDDYPPVGATIDYVLGKYPVKVTTPVDEIRFKQRLPLAWDNEKAKTKIAFVLGNRGEGYGELEHFASGMLLGKELEAAFGDVDAQVFVQNYPRDMYEQLAAADSVIFFPRGGRSNPFDKGAKPVRELLAGRAGVVALGSGLMVMPGNGQLLFDRVGARGFEEQSMFEPRKLKFSGFPDHPVSQGLEPFEVADAWLGALEFSESAKHAIVILKGDKGHPVLWLTENAEGRRSVGFSGGYHHFALGNAMYRKALLNAMAWSAGLAIPKGGIPTAPLPLEALTENQNHTLPVYLDREELIRRFGLKK
jgi:type 1 glutamine amidotransferase